jgi:beta-lactamase regulating signal transducer with metallopeptidase domain
VSAWLDGANEAAAAWAAPLWRATWQGAVALGLVWLFCRVFRSLSSATRSWLWRLAYLKLLLSLFWSAPVIVPLLPPPPRPVPAAVFAPPAPAAAPAPAAPTYPLPPPAAAVSPATTLAPAPARPGPLLFLLVAWTVGTATCAARVGLRWRRAAALRAGCRPLEDEGALAALAELCRRAGVRRPPALLAGAVPLPLLVGVRRPAILLPAGRALPAAEQRLVLAHELAHVKRRDLLWAWLPVLARCLFFFHPVVWLAHAEWRLAQELACDELTLRLTKSSPADYGEMLVRLAAGRREGDWGLSAAGLLSDGAPVASDPGAAAAGLARRRR